MGGPPRVAVSCSRAICLHTVRASSGEVKAASSAARFGWVAMIGTVLWSGVRYAYADDGVTIA